MPDLPFFAFTVYFHFQIDSVRYIYWLSGEKEYSDGALGVLLDTNNKQYILSFHEQDICQTRYN